MCKITNDKTLVVGCVAHQAHAVSSSAARVEDRGVVHTNVHLVADDFIQALRLGLLLVDVVNVAMSWIGYLHVSSQRLCWV